MIFVFLSEVFQFSVFIVVTLRRVLRKVSVSVVTDVTDPSVDM